MHEHKQEKRERHKDLVGDDYDDDQFNIYIIITQQHVKRTPLYIYIYDLEHGLTSFSSSSCRKCQNHMQ